MAMMYATCIVQDEATGVTCMDIVTTSVGTVAPRNPHMVANLQGPTMEDITDLSWGAQVGGLPETERLWQLLPTRVKTL